MRNLQGQTFGRLKVLSFAGYKSKNAIWKCQCSCSEKVIMVRANHLVSGKTISCGCARIKHGACVGGHPHERTYQVWTNMLRRCNNPNYPQYKDYGGRGITVGDRWKHSYEAFREDMGDCPPGLSIERRDNNLGYFKDNCYWSTRKEQANNRRTNRRIEYCGITKTLANWCDEFGVNRSLVQNRICRLGWTFEEAMFREVKA